MTGEEGYTVVGTEHYTAEKGHGGLSTALFFLVGAAVGAGMGLLLTPQSGWKTRRQIREASRETTGKMMSCYAQVVEKMGATFNKGKGLIREGRPLLTTAIEAGKDAYERERTQRVRSDYK
ncbi:MAG: YtxH domain-containing protein [Syntrophorhabdales bacterium]|jgi:gas vesicle protein